MKVYLKKKIYLWISRINFKMLKTWTYYMNMLLFILAVALQTNGQTSNAKLAVIANAKGKIWNDIVIEGKKGIVEALKPRYKCIDDYLNNPEYANKVSIDFAKHQAKGGKLNLSNYTAKHRIMERNRRRGKTAEEVFRDFEAGFKPPIAKQTNDGRRKIDNLLDGTAREIKSGKITLHGSNFQRQITKDLEILKVQALGIDKVEWHALGGINEDALQFIRDEMTNKGISPDLFKVVIYYP
jgi:hypothetical protein